MRFLRNSRKPIAIAAAGVMLATSAVTIPAARAELVGTDRLVTSQSEDARARVEAFMARGDVQAEMQKYGVSPAEAEARVASLSDAEVERIAGRIDEMPAGEGALGAIIGAAVLVFLVLLITDLLGFTNAFSFTEKGAANPNN